MEAILRHHLPRINLDVEALRQTCESLPSWPDLGQSSVPAMPLEPAVAPPASESPGIEDENCTVEYVDDTTARMSAPCFTRASYTTLTNGSCCAADYSGEFSHWNFSMHIKRNIDDLISKSNVKVRQAACTFPCLPMLMATRPWKALNAYQTSIALRSRTRLRLPSGTLLLPYRPVQCRPSWQTSSSRVPRASTTMSIATG